jgi:TldD protein
MNSVRQKAQGKGQERAPALNPSGENRFGRLAFYVLPLAFCLLCPGLLPPALAQQKSEPDVILRAMKDELQRSRALRVVNQDAPYFLEYALFDGENTSMSATLGGLVGSRTMRFRYPRVQVRVGDYKFDNTNYVGTDYFSSTRYDVDQFPLENIYGLLRHHLWLATDTAYKGAVEAISQKRAALKNVTVSEDLADFAKAEPVRLMGNPQPALVDEAAWNTRIKRLSAVFAKYPQILTSSVDLQVSRDTHYLVNSEGTEVRSGERVMLLRARASGQAPDGMLVRDAAIFETLDPDRFPSEPDLERSVRQVADNVAALVGAPMGESYTGPILFEGTAGPQILAELLAGNLIVPRRPVAQPGRPMPFRTSELEGRLNSRILPEWMDVVDDPTQTEWRGRPLFGTYDIDLEGVRPKPASLVEKGVLKGFLLTRQPIRGFEGSNGHARLPGAFGAKAAACSNLFVRASEGVSPAELRKKLIETCKQRGKPYGIVIRKMDFPSSATLDEVRRLLSAMAQSGGSGLPVSMPLLAYKVFPDGREELVRGLRFKGLTARALKDIVAASDETYVFDFLHNQAPFALMEAGGYSAETSVIAPALLMDDLELERPQEEFPKLPIVPAPSLDGVRAVATTETHGG